MYRLDQIMSRQKMGKHFLLGPLKVSVLISITIEFGLCSFVRELLRNGWAERDETF